MDHAASGQAMSAGAAGLDLHAASTGGQAARASAEGLSHPSGPAGLLAQAWARATQRRPLFDTAERDAAQAMVGRVFRPHRLEPQRVARLRAGMQRLGTGLLGVVELQYGDTVDILPGPLESFYLLQMPIAGQAQIETAGRSFVSDTGCASLVSPSADLRMRWLAGNRQLCVRIEAETLRRFISAWSGRPCERAPVFEPQLLMDRLPRLVDVLLAMIDASQQDAVGSGSLCAAQLQYRLLAVLLAGVPHDAHQQLQGSTPPLAPHSVRRVEEYLVSHCDEAVTPESLAAMAGVSIRSLFLGFQRYRGVSPMRLLHELRLRRAHEELLQAAPGTRITDVAHRWGLSHLGRFSRDYRESFGESPSETLRATCSLLR